MFSLYLFSLLNKMDVSLNKDVTLYLFSLLNDRDLLNLCVTSKKYNQLCSDEGFWRRRLIDKYGSESVKYKTPDETYHKIYLSIIYYLDISGNNFYSAALKAGKNRKNLAYFFLFKNDFSKLTPERARGYSLTQVRDEIAPAMGLDRKGTKKQIVDRIKADILRINPSASFD